VTHLSCFSGIGGIDLAAEQAGMATVGQIEIDKQCRSVLRRHWPDVPKHEDIADGAVEFVRRIGGCDILSGGVPCTGFSVAGRREGLADHRSGLFSEFLRLVAEFTPRWVLVENVPGLLSSERGEDLAAILGEWTGFRPAVPADGWRNSGVCLGPSYAVAWAVLDAQWFGVPQRRRRVFLVGRARNAGRPELPATVLFEPESLRGDPPPRREAGQGVARSLTSSPGGASGKEQQHTFVGGDGAPLNAMTVSLRGRDGGGTAELGDEVGNALRASQGGGDKPHVLTFGHNKSASQTLRVDDEVAEALQASPQSNPAVAYVGPHGRLDFESETFVAEPIAVRTANFGANGLGVSEGTSYALDDAPRQAVCFKPSHYTRGKDGAPADVTPHLSDDADKGDQDPLCFVQNTRDEVRLFGGDGNTAGALPSQRGSKQQSYLATGYQVRRLTAVECSRLQGLPDDWTAHGLTETGDRIDLADGPRYRMLGNSVAVPCVAWIMRRIAAAEEGHLG